MIKNQFLFDVPCNINMYNFYHVVIIFGSV